MARLDWSAVLPEHYNAAAKQVARDYVPGRGKDGSEQVPTLYVEHGGVRLPAKTIAREAYRLAHKLPGDTKIQFSSGESTRLRLEAAGLVACRLAQANRRVRCARGDRVGW